MHSSVLMPEVDNSKQPPSCKIQKIHVRSLVGFTEDGRLPDASLRDGMDLKLGNQVDSS